MPANLDYGALRRRAGFNATTGYILAGVVGLAGAGVWTATIMRSDASAAKAHAAAWTVTGPPCPQITAAWLQMLKITPIPFAYESIRGTRAHGDVNCEFVEYDGQRHTAPFPVCQFSAPLALTLATPTGDVYFEPGAGKPATVSMPDGKLRCVIGASQTDD